MNKKKKKLFTIFAGCMFAVMMMLNVTTTINGDNFSVDGYVALVNGSTGEDCSDGTWDKCCKIWNITLNDNGSYQCKTGGSYKCDPNC